MTTTFNTVAEIKQQLLLEAENQTVTDPTIQSYLEMANMQVYQMIKRNYERDNFTSYINPDGTTQKDFFVVLSPIRSIVAIMKNNTPLTNTDYTIVYENSGVNIPGVSIGDVISILYVPETYTLLERALAILGLLTRFNPFTDETNSTVYAHWKQVKDQCYHTIRSNFGTSTYSSQ